MPATQESRIAESPSRESNSGAGVLYVVNSGPPYSFSAYTLPLHSREVPTLKSTSPNEPVPLAQGSDNLYVGSFTNGVIATFPLPLKPSTSVSDVAQGDVAGGFLSGLGDMTGLAVNRDYLYAAGLANNDIGTVFEYRLPLVDGEQPSGSLTASEPGDYLAVATHHSTLFVAATFAGTISAYSLPLRKNEQPEYTIPTTPDAHGGDGIAVSPDARYLYVSIVDTRDVYQYALPYHDGDQPTKLDVTSQTGQPPNSVTVRGDRLFVSAGQIAAYKIPITSSSKPTAKLWFDGVAAGLATSN